MPKNRLMTVTPLVKSSFSCASRGYKGNEKAGIADMLYY